MSYKPDESVLTSYLYDELSKEEHAKVDAYLKANPEVQKELEGIKSMLKFMGKYQDREVVEPSFVFEDSPTIVMAKGSSFNNFLKSTIAIAASLSLLILVGYFTQMKISSNENGLHLSFGNADATNQPLQEQSIRDWMNEALVANNADLLGRIAEIENNYDSQSSQLEVTNSKMNQLANYKIDQEVVDRYVSQITQENREIILDLMEISERSQKQYMDDLMTDFAKFMESQRQGDLDIIQGHLNALVDNSEANQIDDYRNSE